MRTKSIINPDFKERQEHFDDLFRNKLKALLKYRKLSQDQLSHLCNKKTQNATSRWMTLNDKYKTSPNISETLAMCAMLRIDMNYFYKAEMSCEEADMELSMTEKYKGEKNDSFFLKTSVVNKLFQAIEKVKKKKGVGFIFSPGNNGTSRALEEFARLDETTFFFPDLASYEGLKSKLMDPHEEEKVSQTLLFDNCEKLVSSAAEEIVVTMNHKQGRSVIFVGKQISVASSLVEYQERAGVLIRTDIEKIVDAVFPKRKKREKAILCSRLVGGIDEIVNFISQNI